MNSEILDKYKGYFMAEVEPEERRWGFAERQVGEMRKGMERLQNKRTRLVKLLPETPRLEYLEKEIKEHYFPLMAMDDMERQWIHYRPGSGIEFGGGIAGMRSPSFVAARALILLGSEIETDLPINIMLPIRETRVCLEAMDMLRQDIGGKVLEVRLPWLALAARKREL